MAFRKFWLENSLGNIYDFTKKTSKSFLNEPDGLGFTKSLTLERIGKQEKIIYEQVEMPNISGELLFYKGNTTNKYQDYYDFIQFIKYKPLKLHILPPNSLDNYYCDISIIKLEKTEVDRDSLMHNQIEFKCLNHWKTSQTRTIVASRDNASDSKDYPLSYPYEYGSGGLNNIILRNEGTEAVDMIIEIRGHCENPQVSLFNENDEQYGLLKLDGEFDYVRMNSNDLSEELYLEVDGLPLSNPMQYQDFMSYSELEDDSIKTTFIQLEVGNNSMSCSFDNYFDGVVVVTWRPVFATM